MHKSSLQILVAIFFFPVLSQATIVKATLFPPNGRFEGPLFTYEKEMTKKKSGDAHTRVRYWDMNQKLAMEENYDYRTDGSLEKFTRTQHQIGEDTRMERNGSRVEFYKKEKGKEEKDSETWTAKHKTTDQIYPMIVENYDSLMAGKDVEFRLLVASRMDTVAFVLTKVAKEGNVKGQPTQVFAMEGGSMIIRSMIDPVLFHLAKDGSKRLLMIDGRMPVKNVEHNGEYNDVVGQLLFDAPTEATKASVKK